EVADQQHEETKVSAVGQTASAGVQAYALSLPNDGGSDQELVQPKDIQRFDGATFTWDGGNNYTDNPYVTVERQVGGTWVPFADQSGEVPVTVTIGPVDYPDTVKDQKATGARFLNSLRGYSGTSMTNVEHYCDDCTFRPWLDATDDLTATLVITHARGKKTTEKLGPSP